MGWGQLFSWMISCVWSLQVKESQNRRTVEWFGLDRTSQIIWFQPPCHGQGDLPPDPGAPSTIQPGLEYCQGGGSLSFSGQPGSGPHHPHSEELLSYI